MTRAAAAGSLPPGPASRERLFAALGGAGMPRVRDEFSVVPQPQVIAGSVVAGIAGFIRVFDRVTTRTAWRTKALREAPEVARSPRSEVCFFSAWDFHLPPEAPWQLIEFNDNGSGLLFAGIINAVHHETVPQQGITAPASLPVFRQHIAGLVEAEAKTFFGERPAGLCLILDDADSQRQGRFRRELELLSDLLRQHGWDAELGSPADTRWDGRALLLGSRPVSFIINRSTDFFWQSTEFAALRAAAGGGHVYVAPNPFSYATRSDKRLLEWLSLPYWDEELGVTPEERRILTGHVPETHVVRAGNVEALEAIRQDLFFKPLHGFAGRGLLSGDAVGRRRLRGLARLGYVAQRRVPKPTLEVEGARVWTDLRVWAWRGEILCLSGRASRRPDRLDLTPPGGWLPTYIGP